MKRLLPALCLSFSSLAMANQGYYDYRQGNYERARDALEKNKNDKVALYYLGQMTMKGYAKPKNNRAGLNFIEQSAARGYLPAQLFMAKYYLSKDNSQLAFKWFKRAADKGNMPATMYVISAYMHGYGVKKNPDKARRYYIYAARKGNPIAQYTLAEHFLERRSYRNRKLAKAWLDKSLKQGNTNAMVLKAKQYLSGNRFKRNESQAQQLLEKAAAKNNANAFYELGKLEEKSGEFYGYDKAIKLYEKAAQQGNQYANYRLGLIMLKNQPAAGVDLIKKAATNGNKPAMRKLAELYKRGSVVEKNEALAKKWYRKSKLRYAYQGKGSKKEVLNWLSEGGKASILAEYQFNTVADTWQSQQALKDGVLNASPQMATVKKSQVFSPTFSLTKPEDIDFYTIINTLAKLDAKETKFEHNFPHYQLESKHVDIPTFEWQAHHGDGISQFKLGLAYQYGYGVEPDSQKARQWYISAVKQKNVRAEYQLGLMYITGDGVEQNMEKGLYWLNKSAFKGNAMSQFVLAVIYDNGYQGKDSEHVVAPDRELAVNMYNLAASEGVAKAQLKLAQLYAKQMANNKYTVAEQKKLHKLSHELYFYAYKNGLKQAALPLAFYTAANPKSDKDLKWAFAVAEKLAARDDANAALLLGLLYDRGLGTPMDKAKGAYWFEMAAKQHSPIADFMLGTSYFMGNGVKKSISRSQEYLNKAASQHLAYADYNLAMINQAQGLPFMPELEKAAHLNYPKAELVLADYYLLNADGSDKLQMAASIYSRLAQMGYAKAQLKLAYMYQNGIYFPKDKKKAYEWMLKSARQDQPIAQFLLAKMYQLGTSGHLSIKKANYWYQQAAKNKFLPAFVGLGFLNETIFSDYVAAEDWYYRAAHQGSEKAQYDLGLIYLQGKGLRVDNGKAVKWLSKAAKQGNVESQTLLGLFYLNGTHVKKSPQKAYEYFIDAARGGSRVAYYQLGLLYETGVGTQLDAKRAVAHYQQAALQGSYKAQFAMGRMYDYGIGVMQDKNKAVNYYVKAASADNAAAQYRLGLFYLDGLGVDKDINKAKAYFKKAAQNGSYRAQDYYNYLSKFDSQSESTFLTSQLQPVPLKAAGQREGTPNLLYLNAITDLNQGQLQESKKVLNEIRQIYPDFNPAKKVLKNI